MEERAESLQRAPGTHAHSQGAHIIRSTIIFFKLSLLFFLADTLSHGAANTVFFHTSLVVYVASHPRLFRSFLISSVVEVSTLLSQAPSFPALLFHLVVVDVSPRDPPRNPGLFPLEKSLPSTLEKNLLRPTRAPASVSTRWVGASERVV